MTARASVRVCERWDPLWAEDKQPREENVKLEKPGRPDSIVRYPNTLIISII